MKLGVVESKTSLVMSFGGSVNLFKFASKFAGLMMVSKSSKWDDKGIIC